MKQNVIISAAILAAGLALGSWILKSGIDNFVFNDRVVSVRGLAERDVEANHATWSIGYTLAGNTLKDLYNTAKGNNSVITSFLTDNGIPSADVYVNPPSLYDAQTSRYRSDSFRYNYTLEYTITVSTSEVDKVRQLQDRQGELLDRGIAINNSNVYYEYTDLNSIKPEMIAEATHAAREAALRFADDSDSNLGKIKTASQGQFSIEDSDSSTPFIKKVRVVSTIIYYLED